ncbi:hypothetical protein GCM10009734_05260 [Nonomuraea bangladeshensis]
MAGAVPGQRQAGALGGRADEQVLARRRQVQGQLGLAGDVAAVEGPGGRAGDVRHNGARAVRRRPGYGSIWGAEVDSGPV